MSVGYSLLAGILAIAAMGDDEFTADHSPRGEGWPLWRGALTALGAVTFAYGGHRYDTGCAVTSGNGNYTLAVCAECPTEIRSELSKLSRNHASFVSLCLQKCS